MNLSPRRRGQFLEEGRFFHRGPGCWLWHIPRLNGYGAFGVGGKKYGAHRVMFYITRGFLPTYVCHHCDNGLCVNPSHLFAGDATSNNHDMMRKGRFRAGEYQLQKTHCPQGHPYSKENTYVSAKGYRHCRHCLRQRMQSYRQKNKEGALGG